MTKSIDSTEKELPAKKVRRSAAEIQALLMEYERSGMSAKSFCRIHELKRAYFSRWLLRYGSKKAAKGFVAVDLPGETSSSGKHAGLFAEYRGIKFYQKVEASYLKSLLS
jgi:hypothetical protein